MATRHRNFSILLLISCSLWGQVPQPGLPDTRQAANQAPAATLAPSYRPEYVLGPNDQVLVRIPEEEQINERPFRIDSDGFLNLPVAGRIQSGGLTVQALEAEVTQRLRQYIRNPLVSITVVQYRSEPVFFVGAFQHPGIYALQGRRTLVEMLAAVGGLQANASRRIKITRRAESGIIPLPHAVMNDEQRTSSVEISMRSLTENLNPDEDLILKANDVISVERAERVYISGEVAKVSALDLQERDSISITQALTQAGGFTPTAVRDRVVVLRSVLGTNRRAPIQIDVKRIFEGKDTDFPLLANDVLVVPRSASRAVLIPLSTSLVGSVPYIIVSILLR